MPDAPVLPLAGLSLPSNGNAPRRSLFPKRPKKRFTLDAALVVESVLRRAEQIETDLSRGEWITKRLQRYAKYRGWLPEKTFPWPGCSNVAVPLLPMSILRTGAGLHNVVMTLRPLVAAKATSRINVEKEQAITDLLDAQMFLEPGPALAERRLTDFVFGGLEDGNAVAYTPWVRDERMITEFHASPSIPEGMAPSDWAEDRLRKLFPTLKLPIELDENESVTHRFFVTYQEGDRSREATVEIFEDDDGAHELVVRREVAVYDGPVLLPWPIEKVLAPTRITNLQPPSEANPTGAPYVFLRAQLRLDDVRRLTRRGVFNWVDADATTKIEAAAKSRAGLATVPPLKTSTDELQEQKDILEGREHQEVDADREEDFGHLPVSLLLCFDRWDVDGDGLAEDVFWVVEDDAKVLCEARLLVERWPATTPYRPLADWCPLPVKDRWLGISLLELGEALYDLIKGTFDQMYDGWTMGTIPFFFYGASSKLSADILSVAPGQGMPVPGNPRETVYFPALPQRDPAGGLGIIGLALQFSQQLMSQGPLQQGQVPTGKATALRTFGTTMALLQQGDVRADQMLIRLFQGLGQVALNFHRMNRHLLPPGKEIRIIGWDGPRETGYRRIESVEAIDADVEFEFKPEFLNSNPATLRDSLQAIMALLVTPLTFQLGITDGQRVYRLMRDFIKALRLDPKRYTKEPTPDALPPFLAEEAITMLMQGQAPVGRPLEGADLHLKKLFAWLDSEMFKGLPAEYQALAKTWTEQVAQRAQQERQAAMAAQFQQALMQGGGGQGGGVPTTIGEPQIGGNPVPHA